MKWIHDPSLSRMQKLWWWKGELLCRFLGHNWHNETSQLTNCKRCKLWIGEVEALAAQPQEGQDNELG